VEPLRESIGYAIRVLRLALAFLTILPIGSEQGEASHAQIAAARYAFPVVGGLIGLALAALSWGLARAGVGPGLTSFLLVAAGVGLTGGLHLDGLADSADGLFLPGDAQRRLAVMKDPHVGSFGGVAIVLLVLGKYAALNEMTASSRFWGVLAMAVVGRSLILVSAGMAGYARLEGTGRIFVEATTLRDAFFAGLLVLLFATAASGRAGLLSAVLTIGLAAGLSRLAVRRLGGVTGDTLGAVVESGEWLFLSGLALLGNR
jgi:adenosylcobinamide-GDP ribazoletransferase